jgi:hypothetical protein
MRFVILFPLIPLVSSFIFDTVIRRPGLDQVVESQTDQRVAVSLDIGTPEEHSSRLAVKGLVLDLKNELPSESHVKMPGYNGPHPNLSSGIRRLDLVEEGSFISQTGKNIVSILNGCWEFVWRDGAAAGSLLCGFELPEEYKRNDAKLPKGRVYLAFPIWTKETLEKMQDEKARIMELASQALVEKDKHLAKMHETGNIFQKALHYRNAFAAAEKYIMQPTERMKFVPSKDEVIPFQEDLLITTKGTVWTKNLPNGKQVLLGSAILDHVPMENEN